MPTDVCYLWCGLLFGCQDVLQSTRWHSASTQLSSRVQAILRRYTSSGWMLLHLPRRSAYSFLYEVRILLSSHPACLCDKCAIFLLIQSIYQNIHLLNILHPKHKFTDASQCNPASLNRGDTC